jgi:prevent-host-death family protein
MRASSIAVPLAEAKNKLSELVDRVSRGEEFVITRHNTEIARLVPVRRPPSRDIGEAIAKMRATRKRRSATVAEIREWRNEGRR